MDLFQKVTIHSRAVKRGSFFGDGRRLIEAPRDSVGCPGSLSTDSAQLSDLATGGQSACEEAAERQHLMTGRFRLHEANLVQHDLQVLEQSLQFLMRCLFTDVVICVHGLTRCARDFDNLARALCGRYRVVCPDVAGRGDSDWLADPMLYQIPQYVSDMVTLIARLDV